MTMVLTPEREEQKGEAQACEGAEKREEDAYMHRGLAESISSPSAPKSGPASQKEGLTARMRASAEDLSVMIKHCNKDAIGRLKGRTATQAVADPPVDRVLVFQHLRSEDIKLFVRKEEDVVFLCHHPQWTRFYCAEARVQLGTFGDLMHSVRSSTLALRDRRSMAVVFETSIDANTTRIPGLAAEEIVYM
jgi:hypothetical protein